MNINFFFYLWDIELRWRRSLYDIDVQVFGGKLMKNHAGCCWVPFRGFHSFSCPFYLGYHHAAVSEVSLRFVPYLHIMKCDLFCCLACHLKSPPQRRNVTKYFRKEVNLARNLFHKQHVYHPTSINIQQSFHLGCRTTLYREGVINVNRNLR